MMTKQYLLLPDTTIQKLELKKMTAWEIKYIFKSISNFNQNYNSKDEKRVKTLQKKLSNFDFISTRLFDKTKGTRISFDKNVIDINKSKTYKKPYACYYLDTIEGIKKKKSLLLYTLIQMTAKKSNRVAEKQIEIKAKDLADYVDYRKVSNLDAMISDINSSDHRQQIEYTYIKPEKSFVFTIKDIKDTAGEKRSLALDTISNKALEDVSDLKLEQTFLEIATEVINRNGGASGVVAVDMLNDLKHSNEPEFSNEPKHLDIDGTFDAMTELVNQNKSDSLALSQIAQSLDKIQEKIKVEKSIISMHHYTMAKDISSNQKQPNEALKLVLNYLKNKHKQSGSQKLNFNIFEMAKELGFPDDESGVSDVAFALLKLVEYRYADVQIIGDTVTSYDSTPNFEQSKKAHDKAKAISTYMGRHWD